jgi:Flp pilus assembly pilin Flp
MPATFTKFLQNDGAATAIEYALALGVIALAASAAFGLLGQTVNDMYGHITSSVIDVMPDQKLPPKTAP